MTEVLPLIVGIPGTGLSSSEFAVLESVRPAGVILFARNISSAPQVRSLVANIEDLEPRPFVAVDLEGGLVNRLSSLWGQLPSPAAAAAAGRRAVRDLGEAAGAACRALGIHLDFAPVIDLDRPGGLIPSQERCLSDDPERVASLARVFHEGLSAWGVEGCLKHFPGLGGVDVDTHVALPTLPFEDHNPHLQAFVSLSCDIPLVMVGHAIAPDLGDATRPASLSRTVVDQAAELPGSPIILSDDLEMGAIANLADLPILVVKAIRARNHGILVCNAFDRLQEIADLIDDTSRSDPGFKTRVNAAAARLGTLRRDLCQKAAAVPRPDDETVAQLWHQARSTAGVQPDDTL